MEKQFQDFFEFDHIQDSLDLNYYKDPNHVQANIFIPPEALTLNNPDLNEEKGYMSHANYLVPVQVIIHNNWIINNGDINDYTIIQTNDEKVQDYILLPIFFRHPRPFTRDAVFGYTSRNLLIHYFNLLLGYDETPDEIIELAKLCLPIVANRPSKLSS